MVHVFCPWAGAGVRPPTIEAVINAIIKGINRNFFIAIPPFLTYWEVCLFPLSYNHSAHHLLSSLHMYFHGSFGFIDQAHFTRIKRTHRKRKPRRCFPRHKLLKDAWAYWNRLPRIFRYRISRPALFQIKSLLVFLYSENANKHNAHMNGCNESFSVLPPLWEHSSWWISPYKQCSPHRFLEIERDPSRYHCKIANRILQCRCFPLGPGDQYRFHGNLGTEYCFLSEIALSPLVIPSNAARSPRDII